MAASPAGQRYARFPLAPLPHLPCSFVAVTPSAPHVPSLEETGAGAWVRAAFILGGMSALAGLALLGFGSGVAHLLPPGSAGWRAGCAAATLGSWIARGGLLSIAIGTAAVLTWLVLPSRNTEPPGP